eukprot:TRINITY_DN12962_c0_g1_i1.p1 TRINITY_DN12962_c0_g1~~TRINITY_DN12962_c0_g1_i1.p1  ORF type:complete len:420 (+),score=95.20 TRINITY_DN12962_c0_g1_i1:88-1347(+)
MTEHIKELLKKAKQLVEAKDPEALPILKEILSVPEQSEETANVKINAISSLGEYYSKLGAADQIRQLLKDLRPFFQTIPKARTAKIVRNLMDQVSATLKNDQLLIELINESIEWTKSEKRTFLRQRLESKLAATYFKTREFQSALKILGQLTREVKKLDDKPLLVEIFLLESYIQHALGHLPKARAALTASRTAANAIYCPPILQAQIDIQSGTLHAEERDYKTAYSYFYEAFESYSSMDDPEATKALKYMLLCKIMTNNADEISSIVSGKLALKYDGKDLQAMKAIALAHKDRSIKKLEDAKGHFLHELSEDPVIERHLTDLYENLLEENLGKIIEPFSQVEISHVANLVDLPQERVERKLSQMILDKKLNGILDQGNNCLIVFDEPPADEVYPASLDTISNISKVVDSLYNKAGKLS